jgi:hypothetical protein
MSPEWQDEFIGMVEEMRGTLDVDNMPGYQVNAVKRHPYRFVSDPYRDYDRGRRRIPRRKNAE